jgi:hypothetical protein
MVVAAIKTVKIADVGKLQKGGVDLTSLRRADDGLIRDLHGIIP